MKVVESSVSKKTPNPAFNEAFVFHVPLERIQETEILLTLSISAGEEGRVIGKVSMGASSTTDVGKQHWSEMLSVPRHPVAQWHNVLISGDNL